MSEEQEILTANKAIYRAFEKKDGEVMSTIGLKGTATLCIQPGRGMIRHS